MRMKELSDQRPQLRIERLDRQLRGKRLQEVAVDILRREVGVDRAVHYREWFALLRAPMASRSAARIRSTPSSLALAVPTASSALAVARASIGWSLSESFWFSPSLFLSGVLVFSQQQSVARHHRATKEAGSGVALQSSGLRRRDVRDRFSASRRRIQER